MSSDEERIHFRRIVAAFKEYRSMSETRLTRAESSFYKLPLPHQNLLKDYRAHLDVIRDCIDKNAEILNMFVEDVYTLFDNAQDFQERSDGDVPPQWQDTEKLQATLKQVMRDWSSEGAPEREQCYRPILEALELHLPIEKELRKDARVLVPGAGLGRLVYEVACLGYSCQGNEFSYFMLFTSNFIFNRCHIANMFTIYPWVHQFTNNLTCEIQVRGVSFPDIVPVDVLASDNLISIVAGDFMEVYKDENSWDCVATCFFIDCSSNIVACIETIYHIIKPGGIWINLGPLLYHFADSTTEPSIEPPFEIVLDVMKTYGFIVEDLKYGVETMYAQNTSSMLQYKYNSVFFVCRKPMKIESEGHPVISEDGSGEKEMVPSSLQGDCSPPASIPEEAEDSKMISSSSQDDELNVAKTADDDQPDKNKTQK